MHLVRAKEAWIKVINPSKGSFCRLFVYIYVSSSLVWTGMRKISLIVRVINIVWWINEKEKEKGYAIVWLVYVTESNTGSDNFSSNLFSQ